MKELSLSLLHDRIAVSQLPVNASYPLEWAGDGGFFAIIRTMDEITVVCDETVVPKGVRCEPGWRILMVNGPLEFNQVGVLAALAAPLAQAGISIYSISTFNTDYIFVKEATLAASLMVLSQAGYQIVDGN
jgi:uncharacterized protein